MSTWGRMLSFQQDTRGPTPVPEQSRALLCSCFAPRRPSCGSDRQAHTVPDSLGLIATVLLRINTMTV